MQWTLYICSVSFLKSSFFFNKKQCTWWQLFNERLSIYWKKTNTNQQWPGDYMAWNQQGLGLQSTYCFLAKLFSCKVTMGVYLGNLYSLPACLCFILGSIYFYYMIIKISAFIKQFNEPRCCRLPRAWLFSPSSLGRGQCRVIVGKCLNFVLET